jgi:hypothetical protein
MSERDEELRQLLQQLAVSRPRVGPHLPDWLKIHTAPPPEDMLEPASHARRSLLLPPWHPPGSGRIKKAAAGGSMGEDELSLGDHGVLELKAHWWKTRFELDWTARGFDTRGMLYLTFLDPHTGIPLASELCWA